MALSPSRLESHILVQAPPSTARPSQKLFESIMNKYGNGNRDGDDGKTPRDGRRRYTLRNP
jgi:hypothetical protein